MVSVKLQFIDNINILAVVLNKPPTKESVQPNRFDGVKILVIDDEIDSLSILTLVLEQEGAEVTSATSAALALKIFNESTFDLMISDIGMPEVDGYTLMTKIRNYPKDKIYPRSL